MGLPFRHEECTHFLRFESLSKAESSVAELVLVIPHSNGGEDRIFFIEWPVDQVLIQMEPCHLRDWQTPIPEHALNGNLRKNVQKYAVHKRFTTWILVRQEVASYILYRKHAHLKPSAFVLNTRMLHLIASFPGHHPAYHRLGTRLYISRFLNI